MAGTLQTVPRYLRYAAAVACAVVILSGSMVDPGDGAASTVLGLPVTTFVHLLAYAGFAMTVCYARLAADGRALLLAAATATAYGGMVELLQGTVPYRTADALDALLNAIGASAGALVWARLAPWLVGGAVTDASPDGRTR